MALRQGSECFTKWTHVEEGKVLNRRLHRIELQIGDGGLHTITGNRLPDFILTCTGHGYIGPDLAQILLSPKSPFHRFQKQASQLAAIACWPVSRQASSRLAALRQEVKCFTRLTHLENGQPMDRQLHRMEVLTHGRLYILTGDKLPEFIGICTGQGFKGQHTAQIHMSSESFSAALQKQDFWPPALSVWPGLRDVVHMALGVVGFLVIRFFLELITSVS